MSLNPCFDGMSCEEYNYQHFVEEKGVLILVLLECLAKIFGAALMAMVLCLNPCFDGMSCEEHRRLYRKRCPVS